MDDSDDWIIELIINNRGTLQTYSDALADDWLGTVIEGIYQRRPSSQLELSREEWFRGLRTSVEVDNVEADTDTDSESDREPEPEPSDDEFPLRF